MGCSGVRYDDERRQWNDAMSQWHGLVDATAERALRRDMFAAAALTGLASDPTIGGSWDDIAVYAVRAADALLARLDATAGPTSASVPLPPMPLLPAGGVFWSASEPVLVTTNTGTRMIGRCVQYHDGDPHWVTMDNVVIHGVVGWEPISVPTGPATRPGEAARP